MRAFPSSSSRLALCFVGAAVVSLLPMTVTATVSGAIPPSGKVTLSGVYNAAFKLDHADCYSLFTKTEVVNEFGVYDPSLSVDAPVWSLAVWVPSSKSSPHLGTVDVDVWSSGDQWEKSFNDWRAMPASEVHFTSNGKAGQVDVVLQPLKTTHAHGTVRVVASWKAGTCSSKYVD